MSRLDLSLVQPADILLVASNNSLNSNAIQFSTCSRFSHAILALQGGNCIESVPESGVRTPALEWALRSTTRATLFRHKEIIKEKALKTCDQAEQHDGADYDYLGAVRSGFSSGCGPILNISKTVRLVGATVILVDEYRGNHQASFFCSELIAEAFERTGIPLLNIPSHAVTPGALATSNRLKRIKTLI